MTGALRMRLARMSFRGRLALWYAVAVPLLVFLLAWTAQAVLVAALQASRDDALERRADALELAILASARVGPDEYELLIERLTEEQLPAIPLLLRVADAERVVQASFGEIPDPLVSDLDRLLAASPSDQSTLQTVRAQGQDSLRVYTAPVRNPRTGETIAIIQTANSLTPVTAAQTRLWWYTAGIGIAGSLITVLVGLMILRHSFRPLDRILRRVREMETAQMSEGLPEEPRPPELQWLADSLNHMWRRLDASFSAQQQFLANVSHDLRTPLTVLLGQIDVLMLDPAIDAVEKQSLTRMRSEVERLIRMANNLLIEAQLEAGPKLSPSPVNLRELLEEVVLEMQVLATEATLDLAAPLDVVAMGDHDLLKQAVLNLVDNAVKFTPAGGRVELTLSTDAGNAVIRVMDTGPGIPAEHLARLGESFYKLPRAERPQGAGTGLGLSIVKQVMALHNGSVDIGRRRSGPCTVVTLRMPSMLAVETAPPEMAAR